ncbi:oligouridylate binding protein 1B [Actinidia rufa]|uniref:Oligouridylate binding protein 1B n=1 Tax=Actinidia rufa TaxID=165716 RepID=A0A7J0G0H4_9ERIC|nr:oligouridylate binding protein 1B [Actinidia rufa]
MVCRWDTKDNFRSHSLAVFVQQLEGLQADVQAILGQSRIVLICFEKVVYHWLDLSPRQFGPVEDFSCSLTDPVVELELVNRSTPKGRDWSTYKKYLNYNNIWRKRHSLLINHEVEDAIPPITSGPNISEPGPSMTANYECGVLSYSMDWFSSFNAYFGGVEADFFYPQPGLTATRVEVGFHITENWGQKFIPKLVVRLSQIPSGILPPGFDPSTCHSVSAGLVILSLNGSHLFGRPIKVNWANASGQREDTSSHYKIFVGDLSPEVTDAILFACFSVYPSCSDGRVMWDQKTGRSRGFGFVSLRNQQWLGRRQMRCNWATKGAGINDDKQSSDSESVVELTNGTSEDCKETSNNDGPENNAQYTTVTQLDLHCHFHALDAGVIEGVHVQRDKGFGFVRYDSHSEAALAIQMGNTQSLLCGKQIKCSWGSKPTPPGTRSNPLPPPAAAPSPGFSAMDILSYERQLAMSKMVGVHTLEQATMGMGAAGASQAIYDSGFQNVAAAQQLMCYQ